MKNYFRFQKRSELLQMNEKNRDGGTPMAGAKWANTTDRSEETLRVARAGRVEGIDVSNIQQRTVTQRNTSKGLLFFVAEISQRGGEAEGSNLDDISLSRYKMIRNNGSIVVSSEPWLQLHTRPWRRVLEVYYSLRVRW